MPCSRSCQYRMPHQRPHHYEKASSYESEEKESCTNCAFHTPSFPYALLLSSRVLWKSLDIIVGAFSCLASSTTPAEHKMTPSLVLFRAQILSCPLKGHLLIILCIY